MHPLDGNSGHPRRGAGSGGVPGGSSGWETLDHTADLGFRAWSPTLQGLFTEAATAVLSLGVALDRVRQAAEREVRLEGIDAEELFVSWLQELLFLWTVEGFVGCRFELKIHPPEGQESQGTWRLTGLVSGEAWDPERHEAYTDIKAVTYHNLDIRQERDRSGATAYRVDVILDI
jgi:SHS2 domain-containing protein